MANTVHTPKELFGSYDIPVGSEPVLECICSHTHNTKPGFLFKDIASEKPLFIATDELLKPEISIGKQYLFFGFVTKSSVVVLGER